MSIKSVIPSNHLILSPPSSPAFNHSHQQGLFQCIKYLHPMAKSNGASASASVLPMNNQGWFPLGLTGLNSLLCKELKRVLKHYNLKASVLWHSAFFIVQLSNPYITTGKTIALTRWTCVGKVMSLLYNILSRFIIAFLPRSRFFPWLQSLSTVILES